MSKPINVEAQRVYKILTETVERLKVLSLLNCEFFDEVYKKEEEDLQHLFGQQVGHLLYTHAGLEQSFKQNNLGSDFKMTPLDDEFLPEEAKEVAIQLRKTTSNLVRQFLVPNMQHKLKMMGDNRSNEFAAFIETFEQLKNLWLTKLTTPLEEDQSIKEQLRILQQRTQKLKEIRDQKKEHLQKYQEESKEQKEQREFEIQNLKKQIQDEKVQQEQNMDELKKKGSDMKLTLETRHKEEKKRLEDKIKEKTTELDNKKKNNMGEEMQMRADFKKADRLLAENLIAYDQEMKDQMKAKDHATEQFDQVHHELTLVLGEFKQRVDERNKRQEILDLMKRKEDEQQKQLNLLHRGAEWMQAHWRGLLARRQMAKDRKKKKKKKKK